MRYIYILISYLFITFSSCTSLTREPFSSDRDPNANFLDFKSFAWLPKDSASIQNTLYDNEIVERNMISYANEELENRGYKFNSQIPDLLLKFTFLIEKRNETISYPIYTSVP